MSLIIGLLVVLGLCPLLITVGRAVFSGAFKSYDVSQLKRRGLFGLLVIALLVFVNTGANLLAELWFFESLGQEAVFWKSMILSSGFSLVVGLVVWGVSYISLIPMVIHAARLATGATKEDSPRGIDSFTAFWRKAGSVLSLIFALVVALTAFLSWEVVALFMATSATGQVEPIFGVDVSTFLGKMPFVSMIFGAGGVVLVLVSVVRLIFLFAMKESGHWDGSKCLEEDRFYVKHVSRILAAWFLYLALLQYLSRYWALFSEWGNVYGVSAVDHNVRIPALLAMSILSVLVAGFFVSVHRVNWRNPLRYFGYPIAGYALLACLLLLVIPGFYQGVVVAPKRFETEKPYIAHSIRYTKEAYAVSAYQDIQFAPQAIGPQDLKGYGQTLDNVRVHDVRLVDEYFEKFQGIRPIYEFPDVDVVRLIVDGQPRLAMLATREVNPQDKERLADDDRTWEALHLRYTHGYGVCLALGHEVDNRGFPSLRIKDVPPVSDRPELKVKVPEIYYGERTDGYVVTNTDLPEYHYPEGEGIKYSHYDGTGGVVVGGFWSRLVFAIRFDDLKFLLSGYIKDSSRVLWHRNVSQLASRLAPWLTFDSDPYKVIAADGSLHYVIDGYTTSSWYPYSTPFGKEGKNYIRNSVKVTVDAKNGQPRFWVSDPSDPLLKAWRSIFPGLFLDIKGMPADLQSSLRYPEEFFRIQVAVLSSYHFSSDKDVDVENFFVGEDKWHVPHEVYMDSRELMGSYYTVMQLPGGKEAEGMLIQPVTPANRDNMIAWIGVRMDGEKYGQLVVYRFPKNLMVPGPMTVEGQINANSRMQTELGLLKRGGSNVMRANMMVLPVGKGLLYVKPLFLRSEAAGISELIRVVVSDGTKIGWGRTFMEGLQDMLGLVQTPALADGSQGPTSGGEPLSSEARQLLHAYLELMGEGKVAEAGRKLEGLLKLFDLGTEGEGTLAPEEKTTH